MNQEVYNEVIATHLHKRLLTDTDYVPYSFIKKGSAPTACPNMLGEDEELIPAFAYHPELQETQLAERLQFLVSCFESLGLEDVETYLSKMLTCDYIVGNFDRHYQNFGASVMWRRLHTPRFARYSTLVIAFGVILNHWTYRRLCIYCKTFWPRTQSDRQLQLLSGFEWFEPDRLDGFADEARAILSQNPNMPPARIESIVKGVMMQNGFGNRLHRESTEFSSPNLGSGKDQRTKYSRFPRFRSRGHERCSAKLLCDSNSGQPSKNLHTEH